MSKTKDDKTPEPEDGEEKPEPPRDPAERIADALEGILKIGTMSAWMAQYARLDRAVGKETMASMKTIINEFINPEYRDDLRKNLSDEAYEEKLKVILMKQRIYEYLLFVHNFRRFEEIFPDAHAAVHHWLTELVRDRDFRMVHLRQSLFYPGFSKVVNEALREEAGQLEKLGNRYDEKVAEMKAVAKVAEAEHAYDDYIKNRDSSPAEYAAVEEAGRCQGYSIPLTLSSFRYIKARELDKKELKVDGQGDVN